jgi:hypothetical protein
VLVIFSYYPRGRFNTNHLKNHNRYNHSSYLLSEDKRSHENMNDYDYEMFSNPQYFLNSGCILGRRKEMKELIKYSYSLASLIRDDQQIMLRYALMFPSMVSLDIYHDFSMTIHQQSNLNYFLLNTFELFFNPDYYRNYSLPTTGSSSATASVSLTSSIVTSKELATTMTNKEFINLGVIHCNNKDANNLYQYFIQEMRNNFQTFYASSSSDLTKDEIKRRTGSLLKIVWLINDKKLELAKQQLDKIVVQNKHVMNEDNPYDIVPILYRIIYYGAQFV